MSIFTFHLVDVSISTSLQMLISPPNSKNVSGLIHAEWMTSMVLGSPVFSTSRMLLRQMVVFAQWENEEALENFLRNNTVGKLLADGWHVRLAYLRQWGKINHFQIPKESLEVDDPNAPVVAFTLARMKLLAVPRFIYWGKPVEKQVRDDPNAVLSLAAVRLPNTVATFSVWKYQNDMLKMVHGHSSLPEPKRHAKAMKERNRKDFHYLFTTLRFKPISEHGRWKGRKNIIPLLNTVSEQ